MTENTNELLDAQQNIVDLRQRVLSGEEISPEELHDALERVRKAREVELLTPTKKKVAKKKAAAKKKEAPDAKSEEPE